MAGTPFEDVTARFDSADIQKNSVVGALSVIPILFWLPFAAAKDSAFAKFYSNQGLILLILSVASGILSRIPFIGGILSAVISLYISVSVIVGLVSGFQGRARQLLLLDSIELIK